MRLGRRDIGLINCDRRARERGIGIAALAGQAVSQANFRKAAEAALRDAKPQSENGFKIELAKRCLTHALQMATA